jgi:hypothetical protein
MKHRAITLLLASLGLMAASAAAGWAEFAPLVLGGRTQSQSYETLALGQVDAGLSLQARQNALFRCVEAVSSTRHLVQPRSVSDAVRDNCTQLAEHALRQNPAHSLASLVMAVMRKDAGDLDGMVAALERSQDSAPAEQWLAGMRVELAESVRPEVGDNALNFMNDDLALMAQSYTGVVAIAERYVRQPDFRERITVIVDTLPEDVQARFLRWVEIAAGSRGG